MAGVARGCVRTPSIVLFRGLSETTPQSPQTTPQLDEIDYKIIKVLESRPSVSQRKIAALVGVSYDTVRYHMENHWFQK